jgi:hypothetical protein
LVENEEAKVTELQSNETTVYCDYRAGVFAKEEFDPNIPHFWRHIAQREATAYHEAGHAVMHYALGLGCSGIELRVFVKKIEGELLGAYGGIARMNKESVRKITSKLRACEYGATLFAHGVAAASGPAAELKFCKLAGYPVRTLFGSAGDHREIENAGKSLQEAGRSRYAYERLVWRQAQVAIDNRTVWEAVDRLATKLNDEYWAETSEEPGLFVETMPGSRARAIMRQAGVKPGMFGICV